MTTGGKIERYYRVWKLIYLMSKSLAKFGPIEIQVFYRKLLQATPNCVERMVKSLDAHKNFKLACSKVITSWAECKYLTFTFDGGRPHLILRNKW